MQSQNRKVVDLGIARATAHLHLVTPAAREIRLVRKTSALCMGRCLASSIDMVARMIAGAGAVARWKNAVLLAGNKLGRMFEGSSLSALFIAPVQSGKTLIQQGLAAFAWDNGAALVVVLCGTKKDHLRQTHARFLEQLEHMHRHDPDNPRIPVDVSNDISGGDEDTAAQILSASLHSPSARPALVCILKNKPSMDSLAGLLGRAQADQATTRPILIIDDESDHAGPNTQSHKVLSGALPPASTSPVHKALLSLYAAVPSTGLAQFTATPAANLTTLRGSQLEPRVAMYAEPGEGYCGLNEFFSDPDRLCRTANEAELVDDCLPPAARAALWHYLMACALSISNNWKQCFMEVRPSARQKIHADWKRALHTQIAALMDGPWDSSVLAGMAAAHADMSTTLADVPPLQQMLNCVVEQVLPFVHVFTTNGKFHTTSRQWDSRFGIVVGGANLDRAKTIPYLMSTYIATDSASTPSDSVLQRARMFGYRAPYLDACRVWMPPTMRDAMVALAADAEHLATAIRQHGNDLDAWCRELGASPRDPTRRCVQGRVLARCNTAADFTSLWSPSNMHESDAMIKNNRKRVQEFLKSIGHAHEGRQVAVQVRQVRDLLSCLEVSDADRQAMVSRINFLSGSEILDTPATVLVAPSGYRSRIGVSRQEPISQYVSGSDAFENSIDYGRVFIRISSFAMGPVARQPSSSDLQDVPWVGVRIPFSQSQKGGIKWKEVLQ